MAKDSKKDILFVVDERRMGGVSILLEDMMNMINISKYNIDILVLHNNGDMLSNLPSNVNVIYGSKYFNAIDYTIKEVIKSRSVSLLFNKIRIVLDMKNGNIKNRIIKERKKILDKNYDVEIAFKDGFTALFTVFGDSKRKIHWLHYEYLKTNPNGKYDKLFKSILPEFDEIIAVSEGVMNAFNSIYHLDNKTSVIHNLVDENKIINKSKEISDLVLNKNKINIVSVGRLHYAKGYDRFVNVLKKLNDEKLLENIHIDIYGDGPEENNIKNLIDNNNLNNYITLKGFTNNPYKYIKDYDLFILPSNFESFGLVIIEANILGIPVLATETSATRKIIDDRNNGYIMNNSEEGIYEGLKYIIKNPDEINKYKKQLMNYKYDNNSIVNKIEEVLDK